MSIADQAIAIAKADRGVKGTTFARRGAYGGYLHTDMQLDEGLLTEAVDIFEDGTLHYHRRLPSETEEEMRNRPGRVSINWLRSWVRIWSNAYRSEVTRTLFVDGERLDRESVEVARLKAYYRGAQADAVMEQVDALMRLTGNVVIRPWYDVAHDELVLHVYHGGQVRIIPNPDNPRRPLATILLGSEIARDSDGTGERVPTAEIFTSDEYIRLYAGRVEARESLAVGRPPLAHCFNHAPLNSWRVHAEGPALAELAVTIDSDMYSLRNYATIMQGHGVMVVRGVDDQTSFVSSPGAGISLPPDGDLYYASPGSPLMDWNATIGEMVDAAREAAGIPKTMLDANTGASGAAIIEANGPVAEMREARLKLLRMCETDLLRAVLDVLIDANVAEFASVDPQAWDVSVSYGSSSPSYGAAEKIAMDNHLIGLGVLTEEQILMREYPDEYDSLEEARAELTARKGVQAGEESANMETDDGRETSSAVGASA